MFYSLYKTSKAQNSFQKIKGNWNHLEQFHETMSETCVFVEATE